MSRRSILNSTTEAVDLQALAGVAVARMAEQGLGERKRRFTAEDISALDASGGFRTLYSEERPVWKSLALPFVPPKNGVPESAVVLHFKTPLRLKKDGHLLQEVAFRGLVFRMLTRVLELSHFSETETPSIGSSAASCVRRKTSA